jgi:hypothetical protein
MTMKESTSMAAAPWNKRSYSITGNAIPADKKSILNQTMAGSRDFFEMKKKSLHAQGHDQLKIEDKQAMQSIFGQP